VVVEDVPVAVVLVVADVSVDDVIVVSVDIAVPAVSVVDIVVVSVAIVSVAPVSVAIVSVLAVSEAASSFLQPMASIETTNRAIRVRTTDFFIAYFSFTFSDHAGSDSRIQIVLRGSVDDHS
jgi:hypothetical protein